MAVIEVHGLTKCFGRLRAVDQLTFTVGRGTVVGFLGPNGAGKTTTLRMLLGLVAPSEGTATINGRRYCELANPLHAVGAVLEGAGAHPGRSTRDHLRLQAMAAGAGPARVDQVLELVGLADAAGRATAELSLGMRQRLGLAAALLADPEILILDEPANGLDPQGVRWLRELLRDLAAEGRTVLVSSHILAEVAQTADSVIILDRGRLVAQSALDILTAAAAGVTRIRTPRADELRAALCQRGASANVAAADWVEVTGATAEQIGTLAADLGIPIFETTRQAGDLEDMFFRLTDGTRARTSEAATAEGDEATALGADR